MGKSLKIFAIETSCDETSAAVVDKTTVLSNVIWSQSKIHSKWGGVVPNLAKRAHQDKIDWVIEKAINRAFPGSQSTQEKFSDHIDAVAVTVGPGLAVALEVGIKKAKTISKEHDLPFIPVNHVEGHALSILAKPNSKKYKENKTHFPALSLVASGKHTDIIHIQDIGEYEIVAHTIDDALGEALDKAARMLGFGYPGGETLEKMAEKGDAKAYDLPIPMLGRESEFKFSYSGLKTAFWKLVEEEKPLNKMKIHDLAASFQDKAFLHLERILDEALGQYQTNQLFFGGGVSANIRLRKRVRKICKEKDVELLLPYSKKLCGDNAAMIGVAGYYQYLRNGTVDKKGLEKIDRVPRAKIGTKFL